MTTDPSWLYLPEMKDFLCDRCGLCMCCECRCEENDEGESTAETT